MSGQVGHCKQMAVTWPSADPPGVAAESPFDAAARVRAEEWRGL